MTEFLKLKDITKKIGAGSTPTGGNNVYCEQGIALIRSQNVLDMRFSYNGLAFIDDQQAEKLKGVTVKQNDVLLNITGDSIARSCIVPENILPARVNQHVSIIRCKDSESASYVNYYLQYLKKYLLQICRVGGTRNALTKEAIENLNIYLHEDHKKRAKLLSSLDAKIELNNRINNELEAMAKTLYDYWFVQFDFPDVNGKPYKSSGGKMVYNDAIQRKIPKGWEIKNLSSFAKTSSGGTPLSTRNEYYDNGIIPWINSGEVNNPYIVNCKNYITELGLRDSSAKIFPAKTILVAMYGATAGKVSLQMIDACTNQAICAVNTNSPLFTYYLKFALSDLYDYLINLSSGSARDNLSQNKINELIFIIPNEVFIVEFNKIIDPVIEKIILHIKENQQLSQLRDWLLPMLMNGQVRVD